MASKKKDGPKSKAPAKKGAGKAGPEKPGTSRKAGQLRNKLTEAMQDPLMRDQIVKAIRAMMQEK